MIVQLNCSTSYCQSKDSVCIPSTGEVIQDSVLISIDDIRKVNSKLIELNYEKEINDKLISVIDNDSIIIDALERRYNNSVEAFNKQIKTIKKERNIYFCSSAIAVIALILSLVR